MKHNNQSWKLGSITFFYNNFHCYDYESKISRRRQPKLRLNGKKKERKRNKCQHFLVESNCSRHLSPNSSLTSPFAWIFSGIAGWLEKDLGRLSPHSKFAYSSCFIGHCRYENARRTWQASDVQYFDTQGKPSSKTLATNLKLREFDFARALRIVIDGVPVPCGLNSLLLRCGPSSPLS